MAYQLPITEWVSYTYGRFVCNFTDPSQPGWFPAEVHFSIHEAQSDTTEWAVLSLRNSIIEEVVQGYVENCRVAFNASLVAEAWEDATLVPRSCLLYLDALCIYTIARRGQLYYYRPEKTYIAGLYYDDWQDAMVYMRHIRGIHQTVYELNEEVVQIMGGTPRYIERVNRSNSL